MDCASATHVQIFDNVRVQSATLLDSPRKSDVADATPEQYDSAGPTSASPLPAVEVPADNSMDPHGSSIVALLARNHGCQAICAQTAIFFSWVGDGNACGQALPAADDVVRKVPWRLQGLWKQGPKATFVTHGSRMGSWLRGLRKGLCTTVPAPFWEAIRCKPLFQDAWNSVADDIELGKLGRKLERCRPSCAWSVHGAFFFAWGISTLVVEVFVRLAYFCSFGARKGAVSADYLVFMLGWITSIHTSIQKSPRKPKKKHFIWV